VTEVGKRVALRIVGERVTVEGRLSLQLFPH
jgi:hypothetical protein